MGEGANQVTEGKTGGWASPDAPRLTSDPAESDTAYDAKASGATAGEATDSEVEAKVIEIEQTREEMTTTVEAIGDRLDPANIVSDAKDAVRDATVGKVEDMTSQATDFINDATSSVQEAGGGLVDTVRRNPVPALMVGVGIGLLWRSWTSGNGNGSHTYSYRMADRRDATSWRDADRWRGGAAYADASGGRSASIGDRAGDVADAVGERVEAVGGRVDAAGERVGEMGEQFAGTARDYVSTANQVVTDNVLAAGVVAAAVGAAVGLLLPATETERRVIGDAGSKVIDVAQTTASEAMSGMESATNSAQSETPSNQS
jgi:ElaB/YqjD/DUF883 family membrane-anchored ribosome-binding protein